MVKNCIEIEEDGKRCKKGAGYGFEGGKNDYCAKHKKPGMIYLRGKRCKEPACKIFPTFGSPETMISEYCEEHKKPNMINVKAGKCKAEGCIIQPRFNYKGKRKGEYCSEHAPTGMRDIYSKYCINCDDTRATYAKPNETVPKYCSPCAKLLNIGLVDICNKRCKCLTNPSKPNFNYPGETEAIYCLKCIPEGAEMINIVDQHRMCQKCKKTRPSYNLPGEKNAIFCSKCKSPEMVIVTMKLCEKCNKVPNYGFEGKKPRFCHKHKLPNMVDLRNAICTICGKYACYGYPSKKATRCKGDIAEGMVFNPREKCIVCTGKNKNIAIYGEYKKLRCEVHKLPDDINFIEKPCNSCGLIEVLSEVGVCKYCDPETSRRVALAKQREVKIALDDMKFEYITYDKSIGNGECGRERPDFLFDCGTHFVVLEVDEEQHKGRPCECEQQRMVNISQSLGMPTMFIRYNPDEYKINGVKQDTPSKKRHKILGKILGKACIAKRKTITKYGFLSVIYLFFDDYDIGNQPIQTIIPFE